MPALGYAVHMTPVYEALSRGGYRVLVATRGASAGLLRYSPYVDHVFETPDPASDLIAAALSLRQQLRVSRLQPTAVLTGPQDARTRTALLGALASSGWRGGFAVHPWHYKAPLRYDPTLSRVANNLRLAELLGCDTTACEPRVFFSPEQCAAAAAMLPPGPILAIAAGNSGGQPTAWHDDRWAAVIRHAHDALGYHPVFLGTARDAPVIARIRALLGSFGTSLAGRTGIGELAAVLAQSDLCLSLMTGTLHVARAVGTPTVALGLNWEPPLEWMTPRQPHVRLLRGPDAPRTPGYRCDDLSKEAVIAELGAMAKLYPPSAAARASRLSFSQLQAIG
jgi:ADP-heptose:LPS heptosyltransferase